MEHPLERKTQKGLYDQVGWTWAGSLTDVPSDGEGDAQDRMRTPVAWLPRQANSSTLFFSGLDVSNANLTGNQRPDRIGNGNLQVLERTVNRWLDSAAFIVPGDVNGDGRPDQYVGRFCNSGRCILEGPGFLHADEGLYKSFWIRKRIRARLDGPSLTR